MSDRLTLWAFTGASLMYCVVARFLPDHAALIWLSSGLIAANFVASMLYLVRRGRLSWDVISLNLTQLVLFGCLHIQIHSILGARHYFCPPDVGWFDWAQFIGAHVLRAVDVLDGIEAYGFNLQSIRNATALSGTVLVAMHLMVDVFLLSAAVQAVRRGLGKDDFVILRFFGEVLRTPIGVAVLLVMLLVSGGIAARVGARGAVTWFLWPLDNVLRAIDIGDAFQIYGWRLHRVAMDWRLATMAVAVRLGATAVLAGRLANLVMVVTRGRTKTVQELAEVLESGEALDAERRVAAESLGARGPHAATVMPSLVTSLEKHSVQERRTVIEAIRLIGPHALPAVTTLVRTLVSRGGDAEEQHRIRAALDAIDPTWRASSAAKQVVPDLADALVARRSEVREAAAAALEDADPHWRGSPAAADAIPTLVRALLEKDAQIRKAARQALPVVAPDWPDSDGVKQVLPELIEALSDKNKGPAARAALSAIGPPAVPRLREMLQKKWGQDAARHAEVAAATLQAMGGGAVDAIPHLCLAMTDDRASVRRAVARALDAIREDWRDTDGAQEGARLIVDAMVERRYSSSGAHEGEALRQIGAASVPELVGALANGGTDIRTTAIWTTAASVFGKLGAAAVDAVPTLAEGLRKRDVREPVAKALERMGPEGVSALTGALSSEDPDLRQVAIEALGRIGPCAAAAIPGLVACLANGEEEGPVVKALDKIDPDWRASEGVRQSVPAVIALLQEKGSGQRRNAARTLGVIGTPAASAVPALVEALDAVDGRHAVCRALQAMGSTAALAAPALTKATGDASKHVRLAAVRALGAVGADAAPAAQALIAALDDRDIAVRNAAQEALENVDPDHRLHQP
jgi:HEAT repeat protein